MPGLCKASIRGAEAREIARSQATDAEAEALGRGEQKQSPRNVQGQTAQLFREGFSWLNDKQGEVFAWCLPNIASV